MGCITAVCVYPKQFQRTFRVICLRNLPVTESNQMYCRSNSCTKGNLAQKHSCIIVRIQNFELQSYKTRELFIKKGINFCILFVCKNLFLFLTHFLHLGLYFSQFFYIQTIQTQNTTKSTIICILHSTVLQFYPPHMPHFLSMSQGSYG